MYLDAGTLWAGISIARMNTTEPASAFHMASNLLNGESIFTAAGNPSTVKNGGSWMRTVVQRVFGDHDRVLSRLLGAPQLAVV